MKQLRTNVEIKEANNQGKVLAFSDLPSPVKTGGFSPCMFSWIQMY